MILYNPNRSKCYIGRKNMFRVKMDLDGREETIYNIVSIESCTNEDGNQIILWFDNGPGSRFEVENSESFEVMFYLTNTERKIYER